MGELCNRAWQRQPVNAAVLESAAGAHIFLPMAWSDSRQLASFIFRANRRTVAQTLKNRRAQTVKGSIDPNTERQDFADQSGLSRRLCASEPEVELLERAALSVDKSF